MWVGGVRGDQDVAVLVPLTVEIVVCTRRPDPHLHRTRLPAPKAPPSVLHWTFPFRPWQGNRSRREGYYNRRWRVNLQMNNSRKAFAERRTQGTCGGKYFGRRNASCS